MNKYSAIALGILIIYPLIGNAAMMLDLSSGSDFYIRALMLITELITVVFMISAGLIFLASQGKGVLVALLGFSVLIMFLDRLALSSAYMVALYE